MFRKRLHARMFWALAVLSTAVSSCRGPVGECIGKTYAPAHYRIVNNTKQTISVDHLYKTQPRGKGCNGEMGVVDYRQNNSIPSGSTYYGPLVDPLYYKGWSDDQISFAPTTLIAIRLDQNTIAYYTGYPRFSSELRSWLTANESHLDPSFYTPMPTAGGMDVYGLFYIVGNTGRVRLGLPTVNPERRDIHTSLDPQNSYRPAYYGDGGDFLMTFTVNGLKKSDIAISCKGTPR